MAARPLLSRLRSASASRCASLTLAVLVTIAPLLSAAPARAYDLDESGRWTPSAPWAHLAVHMALLRGDGPHHSKIFHYFGLDHAEFFGGLWGWRPADYSCLTYPDTNTLVPLGFDLPGNGATLFCSGMTTLADGKLFMAGGTQAGTEFGIRRAFTFDAHADSDDAWTELDSMAVHRW